MDAKSLINKFTVYQYMIFFLVVLNLASAFFYGFGISTLLPVLIAVITAVVLDLLIEYFKSKSSRMREASSRSLSYPNSLTTHFFPQSAVISGLLIGGLLTQNLKWYVYVFAGIAAILSKHIIKFQKKHIFNPANFSILLVSIIFGVQHTWWVSSPLLLMLVLGVFIIWRLKRFDLAFSFLISYYLINSIMELIWGSSLNDIFLAVINGGVIYFFSMYMLIEPRTNPAQRKQRIAYGILVAVFLVLFSQYPKIYHNSLSAFFTVHDLPLALAVGNIFMPVLNRFKFELRKKEGQNTQNPETIL